MTDHRRGNIMPGKMRECDGCHRIMRSDNLKNHMKKCKELNQNLNVSNENIRYPFADDSSKMSKSINPKISALADAIVNEEPTSKYLPKDKPTTSLESLTTPPAPKKKKKDKPTTSLEPLSMPKKKTLSISELFSPRDDLTPKVDDNEDITDTDDNETEDGSDDSDDNESYSRIKPIDMVTDSEDEGEGEDEDGDYNDQFWNEKTQIIKRLNNSKKEKNIMNKLLQELKRGERQNKRKLISLLDILKDCGTIDNGCYEKVYNLICSM